MIETETKETEKRYCRYCGSRLMVDVSEVRGRVVLAVKCTKCKRQNILIEEK